MYCKNCGNKIDDTDNFCAVCGQQVLTEVGNMDNARKEGKFDFFIKKSFLGNGSLSYEKAGRIYSIVVVLIQLISLIMVLVFGEDFGISNASLIFLLLDWYMLSKQGIRGVWKIWGFFVIPVYLWIREKKTDRKYLWPVFSAVICVVGVVVTVMVSLTEVDSLNGDTEANNAVSTIESDTSNYQEISFDTEEMTATDYVVLETDSIHSITPNVYIPNTGVYLYEESWSPSKSTTQVSVEVSLKGITFTEEMGGIICYGQYYMSGTSTDSVLVKQYTQSVLGNEFEKVEMIRLNRTFDCSDGSTIASPANNYTVTVRAGTFENCVCMITESSDEEDGTTYTVSYYAPLTGKVLEFRYEEYLYEEYGIEWYLYKEMTSIGTGNGNKSSNNTVYKSNGGNVEYTNNVVALSNGMYVTVPDSWLGKFEVYEGNTYSSFFECKNYEYGDWENGKNGRLFDILLIFNASELELHPNRSALGYYMDGEMVVGIIVAYPTETSYVSNNKELSDAYRNLANTLVDVQFDTSGMGGVIKADEDKLRSVLPK